MSVCVCVCAEDKHTHTHTEARGHLGYRVVSSGRLWSRAARARASAEVSEMRIAPGRWAMRGETADWKQQRRRECFSCGVLDVERHDPGDRRANAPVEGLGG